MRFPSPAAISRQACLFCLTFACLPEPHWHAAGWPTLRPPTRVLAQAIASGPRQCAPAAHEDLYLALLRAIVSQQISTKAAAAIWRRFPALFRPEGYPEPREVLP